MKITKIFGLGLVILAWALFLNAVSSRLDVMNWYQFLQRPSDAMTVDYVWLFGAYPFALGFVAYFARSWIDQLFRKD